MRVSAREERAMDGCASHTKPDATSDDLGLWAHAGLWHPFSDDARTSSTTPARGGLSRPAPQPEPSLPGSCDVTSWHSLCIAAQARRWARSGGSISQHQCRDGMTMPSTCYCEPAPLVPHVFPALAPARLLAGAQPYVSNPAAGQPRIEAKPQYKAGELPASLERNMLPRGGSGGGRGGKVRASWSTDVRTVWDIRRVGVVGGRCCLRRVRSRGGQGPS